MSTTEELPGGVPGTESYALHNEDGLFIIERVIWYEPLERHRAAHGYVLNRSGGSTFDHRGRKRFYATLDAALRSVQDYITWTGGTAAIKYENGGDDDRPLYLSVSVSA